MLDFLEIENPKKLIVSMVFGLAVTVVGNAVQGWFLKKQQEEIVETKMQYQEDIHEFEIKEAKLQDNIDNLQKAIEASREAIAKKDSIIAEKENQYENLKDKHAKELRSIDNLNADGLVNSFSDFSAD